MRVFDRNRCSWAYTAATMPSGPGPPRPVAPQGARVADASDRDKDTRAADPRARQGDDALEQRQAGGQIIPLVEEGADGGGRPDRDQIAATKMGQIGTAQ